MNKSIIIYHKIIYMSLMHSAFMVGERECSFTVPAGEVDKSSLKKGFDASSLYPERIKESDKLAFLDPTTARVFPVTYQTRTPGFERKWNELIIFGDVIDRSEEHTSELQ